MRQVESIRQRAQQEGLSAEIAKALGYRESQRTGADTFTGCERPGFSADIWRFWAMRGHGRRRRVLPSSK